MKRAALALVGTTVVVFSVLAFGRPVVGNAWNVMTGRGFAIPSESSMWRFRVTQMNEGSGEWWLYGEDAERYYQNVDEGKVASMARARAAVMAGFDAQDARTWPDEPK